MTSRAKVSGTARIKSSLVQAIGFFVGFGLPSLGRCVCMYIHTYMCIDRIIFFLVTFATFYLSTMATVWGGVPEATLNFDSQIVK